MSRIQFLLVAAVLALGYVAANALDAALGDVSRLMRVIHRASYFLELWVLIAVGLLFFGGLPLAVFGLLLERQWAGVPMERRVVRVPYAVLMFQIVSMAFSGFWLALTGYAFLWALSEGYVYLWEWLWYGYLVTQILASIAVIPVWRRLLSPTGSVLRLSSGPAVSA